MQYKGYDFVIMTYKQELLQKVQLYSIESELEQCIGRARLLRQDCTVYLFSAFPCEQAEIFVQDYLKQGVTGKRKDYTTIPYSKIEYFSVQTPGFAELVPDCEMSLYFGNGFIARFDFKGNCNIIQLGKTISDYVLG